MLQQKEKLESLRNQRPSALLDRCRTCEQKEGMSCFFQKLKCNAFCIYFLQGGKGNLSSSSFSFSWVELIIPLASPLFSGEREGKNSHKNQHSNMESVECPTLRERSSRQEGSFSRQSPAYSITSLSAFSSFFLKLPTNQSNQSKLLTRVTSFVPRSDTSKHQSK